MRFKFSIDLEYVSYLGLCHVDLKHCYHPATVTEKSESGGVGDSASASTTKSNNVSDTQVTFTDPPLSS